MTQTPSRCRTCGRPLFAATPGERAYVAAGGACQGCRAAWTLRRRPWLLSRFATAWDGATYPESPSWITGPPSHRA